jgi:hypothetical protein
MKRSLTDRYTRALGQASLADAVDLTTLIEEQTWMIG